MEPVIFFIFGSLAIASALFVIAAPQPTRALLSLIVTMGSLTVLYILLGAPFLAMINLIVYAGAVLVLFLFVIMLQGLGAKDLPLRERFPKVFTAFCTVLFFIFVPLLVTFLRFGSPIQAPSGIQGHVKLLGKTLFTQYLLPFELISVLLLLAIFAVVALAKKEERP